MRQLHHSLRHNRPILIPLLCAVLTLLVLPLKHAFGSYAITWFGMGSLSVYASAIFAFILVLKPGKQRLGKHTEEISAVFLAAVWPVFMIAWFGIGWWWFGNDYSAAAVCKDGSTQEVCLKTNAMYFSAITFTSTGYGDLSPTTMAGRWYAAIEALVGHVNALVFVGLLFSRVDRWRNKPKRKRSTQVEHSTPVSRRAKRIRGFRRKTSR